MSRVISSRPGQDRNEPNVLLHTYAMTAAGVTIPGPGCSQDG